MEYAFSIGSISGNYFQAIPRDQKRFKELQLGTRAHHLNHHLSSLGHADFFHQRFSSPKINVSTYLEENIQY
jgi:hypothetical protein